MLRLAFVYNENKPKAHPAALEWADLAESMGAPRPLVVPGDGHKSLADLPDADLLVTLGGDGTLVRTARLAAHRRVPAMGVRFGHVGFLSEVSPADFPKHLRDLLEGHYWVEERAMLNAAQYRRGDKAREGLALNDVVVSRGEAARVIHLTVRVDGARLDEFICDGAIVATATGSTAYSLASGGPILAPTETSCLLTLISPYLSPIRSLVLPSTSCVTFDVKCTGCAALTLDGEEDVQLDEDDEIKTTVSPLRAYFAHLRSRTYFYESLIDRLKRKDD